MATTEDLLSKIGSSKKKARASRGIPRKASNPQRKVRAARSRAKLPEKKIRRVVRHEGVEAGMRWATEHRELPTMKRLLDEGTLSSRWERRQ